MDRNFQNSIVFSMLKVQFKSSSVFLLLHTKLILLGEELVQFANTLESTVHQTHTYEF
jgi:xanthosine utilization system XapX-like protein